MLMRSRLSRDKSAIRKISMCGPTRKTRRVFLNAIRKRGLSPEADKKAIFIALLIKKSTFNFFVILEQSSLNHARQ